MSEADAAAGVNKNGNDNPRILEAVKVTSSSSGEATTTRQRRIQLQYHSTNGLWEQPQPRIKQASQRDAAYLRSSGLVPSSKASSLDDSIGVIDATVNKKVSNTATKDNNDVTRHFARQLGSTDARIRHQTIRQLKAYLRVRSDVKNDGLSEMDLIKLWKCFWYTLYLADRVPVQEELCQQLCSLIWSVAGTMEQDEYIAQSYLDSLNESGFAEADDIDEYSEDENLEDDDDTAEDDEIDFEAKQLALLEEEDDYDDDEELHACPGDCNGCENYNDESEESNDSDADDDDKQDDREDNSSVNPMEDRHCQGAHLAALFTRTFWRTCVREWGKMDKYRIDKFYTCLRYMLAAMYDYMASRHWSLGIIHLFNDALHEEVLLQVPNGVRYHIVDCCLEELCKASKRTSGIPLTEATFIDVLEPFFVLAQTGDGDDPLQQRVVEQILLKFLNQYSVYSDRYVKYQNGHTEKKEQQGDDLVFEQVHVGTISQFIFEIAADDAVTKDEYRKALYGVHKQYERRIREIGPENDVDIDGDSGMEFDVDSDDDHRDDIIVDDEKIDNVDPNPAVQDSNPESNEERKQVSEDSLTEAAINADTTGINESADDKKRDLNDSLIKPSNGKKKKKKRKNDTATAEEKLVPEEKEEVITITKAEQKVAQAAMNEKVETQSNGNKRRNDKTTESESEGSQKRVKFGNNNRARSYKASMDGLTKIDVKPILEKSPERSILLKSDNKNKIIAINHQAHQFTTAQQQYRQPRLQNNHQSGSNNRHRIKGRKSAKEYF
jgi:hypothetical protein